MLKQANLYKDKLLHNYWNVVEDEKYKWCEHSTYSGICISTTNENKTQLISINKDDDPSVIGYIEYCTQRSIKHVFDLFIMSFAETALDKIIFSNDIRTAITDIFEVHNYKYLRFCCAEENPALHSYERLVKNLNGRVVGYEENRFESLKGDICNRILFEISSENYFSSKQKHIDR